MPQEEQPRFWKGSSGTSCSHLSATAADKSGAPRLDHELNVRSAEILTLGQQWLTGAPGKSIRKTIAEIECRGMPALAEHAPGPARYLHLVRIHRHDLQGSTIHKQVEFAAQCLAAPRLKHNAGLQQIGRREQAHRR